MTDTTNALQILENLEDDYSDVAAAQRYISAAEDDIVGAHDGGVHHVPTAVTKAALSALVTDLEESRGLDRNAARKLVIARTLANCIEDSWNPGYKSDTS